MKISRKNAYLLLTLCFLSGCASRLESITLPTEHAPAPSDSQIWLDLQAIRSDNWYYLLNRGATALDWRLRAIDTAAEHIDLQTFIWEFDLVGNLIRSRILAAADRGVRIRILLDDSFLLSSDQAALPLMTHPNIEYRIFNPYKRRTSNLVTREILNVGEFHRLDHRMHNKSMIVDNRIAILGGRNIADQYFGWDDTSNFRDMEVITGGPDVQAISRGFDLYWNNQWSFPAAMIIDVTATEPVNNDEHMGSGLAVTDGVEASSNLWQEMVNRAAPGSAELLLDQPPTGNPANASEAPVQLAAELVSLIDSADDNIWMVSAYLIPTKEFELAIERARKRGVDVKILTNSIRSNNHITAHSAYRKHIRQLLDHGVGLYEVRSDAKDRSTYMQGPVDSKGLALHAKLMVVDADKVFLGSANFDPRSLRINTELGLAIKSSELNRQVKQAIQPDFLLRNAWHLKISGSGHVQWISDDQTLDKQPAQSFMQRIEDWFFAHLPIEGEM